MIACGILYIIIGVIYILCAAINSGIVIAHVIFGFLPIIIGLALIVIYEVLTDRTISDLKKKVKQLEAKNSHDMQ